MAASPRIIVVGGGLAGLAAVIKIAESGGTVDLFSIVPVKRSHSVCAQGGINAAKDLKGEGDNVLKHFDDTVYGGDFLANQTPVKNMTAQGPAIIDLLDRMGVPFNRTPEGLLDFRRFGARSINERRSRARRRASSSSTRSTSRSAATNPRARSPSTKAGNSSPPSSTKTASAAASAPWTSAAWSSAPSPVTRSLSAPAATEPSLENRRISVVCTGSAQSALYQQGAFYANGEFIQVHPTAIPGEDKLRLMSESARGEGGRVWVPRDRTEKRAARSIPESDRWYFLEERYPKYGNLVPRDIATREIFKVVYEDNMGIDGQPMVYLDLTHLPAARLNKLEGILEIYEKFVGEDPREVPMKIFPGMHYTMGGLWVDFDQATNIPGVYAAGEADFSIHGANRLGANSLLSCIYAGLLSGPNAVAYAKSLKAQTGDGGHAARAAAAKRKKQCAVVFHGFGEPLQALARARRHHDQARHHRSLQRRSRRS